MEAEILEPSGRRHAAPVRSAALWAAICGILVVILHALTADVGVRLGAYWSGLITLIFFLAAGLYSARRRMLRVSVRFMKFAMLFPRAVAMRLVVLDRLETWRAFHIAVGIFALLPFWWHADRAVNATTVEILLEIAVILLVLSGLLGTLVQDLLPDMMLRRPEHEVRIQDVEADFDALYVQAEEAVLGHSEQLTTAYVNNLRPILRGSAPALKMLWATLSGSDPAPALCQSARAAGVSLGPDLSAYDEIVGIAERKFRLEQNRFSLRLSTRWLKFHLGLAIVTGVLIVFHVVGVFYFLGL
ncbi:MAG TPA: hypothetical protein VMF10_16285 [Candidatus Aquilonibacter sp.]|nr:hypothetical protein [Candidatus Aquilonibacter sp.]